MKNDLWVWTDWSETWAKGVSTINGSSEFMGIVCVLNGIHLSSGLQRTNWVWFEVFVSWQYNKCPCRISWSDSLCWLLQSFCSSLREFDGIHFPSRTKPPPSPISEAAELYTWKNRRCQVPCTGGFWLLLVSSGWGRRRNYIWGACERVNEVALSTVGWAWHNVIYYGTN